MSSRRSHGAFLLAGALASAMGPHASAVAAKARRSGTAARVDACVEAAERGQKLRQEGDGAGAEAAFAQCAMSDCPAVVRADCAHWQDEAATSAASRPSDASKVGRPPAEAAPLTSSLAGEEPAPVVDPHRRAATWLGAGALAALATAGVLGGWALYERAQLRAACAPTCADGRVDGVHDKLIAADVALAGGVILAGLAVWQWRKSQRDEARTSPTLVLAPAANGFTAGWHFAF